MKRVLNSIFTSVVLALACGASNAEPDSTKLNLGKQVYDQWCVTCHGVGPRLPGTASLAVKYGGSIPAALEERGNLPPELVRYVVRNGVMIMPPFRKTEITDPELDALAHYLNQPKGQ
ncbi:c-type cytochrome [Aquabacterium sp.]|uniref:c-type cytochrome n=1 Tax=Aquabacterium sp. TaxID=1872578 RepID=UPI003BB1015F